MNNLPALSTLDNEISALTSKLAPVSDELVSKAVRTMLAAGLALPSGMNAEKAPEIYAFALQGVSHHGLSIATRKILRGEYEISRAFVPTAPELAAMARAEARVLRDDLTRLKERQAAVAQSYGRKEPKCAETKERILQRLNQFRAQNAALKAVNAIPQEPMTAEKAEYYSGIMALRDAPGVGVEHTAYRRKIASEIAASERDGMSTDR